MEGNEISIQQARIYAFLKQCNRWVTAREIMDAAQVAGRTARFHALNFVKLGIVDQAEVFPGHRYRLSPMAQKRNKTYLSRLEEALTIFALT